jgi:RNA polymerase sigma-70 factor (ECF subfamily)
MLLRDADRAEDVTADVFLKAWHGRRNFRGDGTPLSWLLAITHNSAMSALRSERNNADIETIPEPCDPGADPAGQVDAEIDAAVLREAIRQLTPEQQQVILLRFFQGLPHEQVAARLERNPNAVRAIQFRALSRLRKLLEAPVASTA